MSGILGLAYSSISVDNLPTFMEQADLTDRSFAFYLNTLPEASYMTVPGYENEALLSEMQFHNVVEKKYWSLMAKSIGTRSVITSSMQMTKNSARL